MNPAEKENLQLHFQYDNESIEVVIIENGDDDRDGYVELTSAVNLLAPLVTIRGFNKAVLWTNVLPFHKLTKNNKNYVHVFALCKYLSMYNLSNDRHPPQFFVLKRLISDLIIGAQSQVIDPINDIKTQLCSLQECITNNSNGAIMQNMQQVYQPTTTNIGNAGDWTESLREILRHENASFFTNISSALENIKSLQLDLTNKLAFSNDTMLDSFKSIKDIIIRKK
ncbi:P24 [Buzura suppressaria nucleopolyhedrovirus]|uniref:p24 n=1 Tax=Buzura suppressaria nuclear polyhedrosis virus TaxID=74320 RepID=W5VKL1_NPVBS|nr:P24 [Buzura suppressaria nucleopolyhedrovirus]AHH82695.1 P24 [Buzura suppressaria nucleopolyhedrovirus]AKN91079.1 P24 [Buzura suppressaria nucleopolyhedrovirus]QYF10576.1 P24 [Buzura suppressaria nucleopolyhedrovirus]